MKNHIYRLTHLLLAILWIGLSCTLITAKAQDLSIPSAITNSLERNQIPLDAVSISVGEIEPNKLGKHAARSVLGWRAQDAMNPASTMKILTTLAGLDILGPRYRWRTKIFTDGFIRQGTLKGNLYLQLSLIHI